MDTSRYVSNNELDIDNLIEDNGQGLDELSLNEVDNHLGIRLYEILNPNPTIDPTPIEVIEEYFPNFNIDPTKEYLVFNEMFL